MRRPIIAAVAAVSTFILAQTASAADLPRKAPAYSPPPPLAYNWTGFYVGLNAGGAWGHSDDPTSIPFCGGACYFGPLTNASANSTGAGISTNPSGFTGGVQAGYNHQFGNLVVGIEADFDYFGLKGSSSASGPGFPNFTLNINSSIKTDWLFTVRPRLGWAANNWLFYGTGGLAVTHLKANWSYSDNNTPLPGASESASASETKAGWVIGGGVESALPENWILGAEYLYVKFGSISTTSTNLTFAGINFPDVFNHSADLTSNIVRARLSKKF